MTATTTMTATTMRTLSAILAVFTLSIATPAPAQQPTTGENPRSQAFDPHARAARYGNARAQAVPGGMTAREQAIRECSAVQRQYSQTTWGQTESYVYRACMTEHGQIE